MASRREATQSGRYGITNLQSVLPAELFKKASLQQWIEHVQLQFGEVVEDVILEHVNSVYLMKQEDGLYHLVVYVDEPIYSAELNARRETIKLLMREKFGYGVSVFDIKVSRGRYRAVHPYVERKQSENPYIPNEITEQDLREIEALVAGLEEGRLKDSFRRLLIAEKENSNKS